MDCSLLVQFAQPRSQTFPVFRHSSTSVYYTERKPKKKKKGEAWERGCSLLQKAESSGWTTLQRDQSWLYTTPDHYTWRLIDYNT